MPAGFFSATELEVLKDPVPRHARCDLCKLEKGCLTPHMKTFGGGRKGIMVVAEAPGEHEDRLGRPLIGPTGRHLKETMLRNGIDMDQDCWLTNALICFVGNTPVETPSPVSKVYRRTYSGPLVTIHTVSGRRITGTPNHPIMTPSGWVPLGLLVKDQDLVCRSAGERAGLSRSDVNDRPTTIEEVFESSMESGHVKRVVGRGVDFHGDGEDGEVDVVTIDRKLRDGFQAAFLQHQQKPSLVTADEFHGLSQFSGPLSKVASNLVCRPFSTPDGVMGGSNQRGPLSRSRMVPTSLHGTTLATDRDLQMKEDFLQFVEASLEGQGEGFQSLPFEVTLDRVVDVEVQSSDDFLHRNGGTDGSCHVFNLETDQGYYLADGIIVSNCRPPKNEIKDKRMVDWCRPNLLKEIDRLNPRQIILLGAKPVRSVVGHMWRKSEAEDGGITRWSGWAIPWRDRNCWVCPTFHPSYVQKSERDNREEETIRGVFDLHMAKFAGVKNRPYPAGVPDDLERVKLVYDDAEAAGILANLTNTTVAFDLETDRLKPQHEDSAIASCSVAWEDKMGLRAVAFPWAKKVAREMKALLTDPNVKKIGANLNFETSWIWEHLGVWVKGWCWDTIDAAHCLDCRKGITSVKFQAFVRLGVGDYDSRIKKYLQSKREGGNNPNRIFDCDRELLLKYNALDSLYEYQIALHQAKELGVEV